jgi:hypothetical protein
VLQQVRALLIDQSVWRSLLGLRLGYFPSPPVCKSSFVTFLRVLRFVQLANQLGAASELVL